MHCRTLTLFDRPHVTRIGFPLAGTYQDACCQTRSLPVCGAGQRKSADRPNAVPFQEPLKTAIASIHFAPLKSTKALDAHKPRTQTSSPRPRSLPEPPDLLSMSMKWV